MTFDEWVAALGARHLANLRLPELTRALRRLSSAYVERRHTVGRGGRWTARETSGVRAVLRTASFLTATTSIRHWMSRDAAPSS
jgi:hypothetical protein